VKIRELERTQWIRRSLDRIFPFFERPENLSLITPRWLDFQLLCPSPVKMAQGSLIDYRIRLGGVPLRWRSVISIYEPPHRFVDEQLIGPYAYWYHLHCFVPEGGGTRILDRVRYALPRWLVGPSGILVHSGLVRPALEKIFNYRAAAFERLLGAHRQGTSDGGYEA